MSSAAIQFSPSIKPSISHDFQILKSDELYIGGYASIEIVDKQTLKISGLPASACQWHG